MVWGSILFLCHWRLIRPLFEYEMIEDGENILYQSQGTALFGLRKGKRCKVSMYNSFLQAFLMFFMITISMAFEMSFNQGQLLVFRSACWQLRLVSQLIDAGLIVVLMIPTLSWVFGKWIRGFDMDLCSVYSENVIKIYFSCAVGANCIWYLCMIGSDIVNYSPEIRSILNRVIV